MNNINLIGRLTATPELKIAKTGEGMSYTRFSLAVDRPGKEKAVDFISCIAFTKKAELLAEYTSKGNKIAVIGKLQANKDKEGKMQYSVVVDSIELLEKKREESPEQEYHF